LGTLRPLRKVNPKDANEGSNAEFAEVTQRKKRRGKTRTLRTDPSILSGQAGEARTQDPYARTAYGALSILELERVRHTGVGNLRPTLTKKRGCAPATPIPFVMVVSANREILRCSGLLDEVS
jgi:hypothetical protein